jgi:hypothetical protein
VQRIVVVSIIGIDRFTGGYQAAKPEHEHLSLAGPIPARILRAAQFHEFVPELVEWGRDRKVSYVPKMRTQLVAARSPGCSFLAAGSACGSRRSPTRLSSTRT